MEIGEFAVMVESAVAAHEVVIAFVHCQITYSGRAEAFLGRGDRIIMIKSDATVIVHQPEGSVPINYMRPGSAVDLERID